MQRSERRESKRSAPKEPAPWIETRSTANFLSDISEWPNAIIKRRSVQEAGRRREKGMIGDSRVKKKQELPLYEFLCPRKELGREESPQGESFIHLGIYHSVFT